MVLLPPILMLAFVGAASGARPMFPFSSVQGREDNAYTKYEHYPPYCSTPDEMAKRAVPPLQGKSSDGSSQLVHVTALIRHGARTPFSAAPDYQCWDGYWDDEETGIWNCDLKTYVSPPAATKEKGKQVVDNGGLLEEEPDFLFEKRYDALRTSAEATGNLLNGTCQLGQLIMRGYNQELQNGQHLRQAYFYDGDKTQEEHAANDARMRLWYVTKTGGGQQGRRASTPAIGDPTKAIYQEPNLRYRADDEQRTLMSGQVLLRGLFEQELLSVPDDETSVIRLHTADYEMDVLGINKYLCPRTVDLKNEAYESDEYKQFSESAEVAKVKAFLTDVMNLKEIPYSILDCLMTSICTDRTLPDALNDYDGSLGPTPWGDESLIASDGDSGDYTDIFERIANYAIKNFTFPYKYNDGAYAKLGMGPLWKEMMENILPIVDSANHPSSDTPPPKLALFSGHDTTLMPILATLGNKVWDGTEWAPYASMIQIEIHEMADESAYLSGYAFRLIYNGKVLTSKMDGCADGAELCDSQVLVKQVAPFAKYMERDCASTTTEVPPGVVTEMETAAENLITAPGGVWVVVLVVILSMALGGVLVFLFMKRRMRRTFAYQQRLSSTIGDLSMRVIDDDENGAGSPGGIDSAVAARANGRYGATHEHTMI